ncbi:Uncharacterised protein [Mycobacterium tuberculosis]|nr:Uncharacterised protein [Mycobacterium tuberculosis]
MVVLLPNLKQELIQNQKVLNKLSSMKVLVKSNKVYLLNTDSEVMLDLMKKVLLTLTCITILMLISEELILCQLTHGCLLVKQLVLK